MITATGPRYDVTHTIITNELLFDEILNQIDRLTLDNATDKGFALAAPVSILNIARPFAAKLPVSVSCVAEAVAGNSSWEAYHHRTPALLRAALRRRQYQCRNPWESSTAHC